MPAATIHTVTPTEGNQYSHGPQYDLTTIVDVGYSEVFIALKIPSVRRNFDFAALSRTSRQQGRYSCTSGHVESIQV